MSHNLKVCDLSALLRDSSVFPESLSNVESMFWMYAHERPYFQETLIAALCTAFEGLRPILWSIAMGKGSLEQLQDYHRGFGFKASELEYVQKMDIVRQDRPKKVYADVVWLAHKLYPIVADELSVNSLGVSLTLSFIPDTPDASYTWANATIGLFWQNLMSSNKLTIQHQRRRELAYRNILEYVHTTTEIGGVALLSASDVDMRPSILGFGSHKSVQCAFKQFEADFEILPESEGRRLFLRKRPILKGTF